MNKLCKYLPYVILAFVLTFLIIDQPNVCLDEKVIISTLETAQGIGVVLSHRVYEVLNESNLVVMNIRDRAYEWRKLVYIVLSISSFLLILNDKHNIIKRDIFHTSRSTQELILYMTGRKYGRKKDKK